MGDAMRRMEGCSAGSICCVFLLWLSFVGKVENPFRRIVSFVIVMPQVVKSAWATLLERGKNMNERECFVEVGHIATIFYIYDNWKTGRFKILKILSEIIRLNIRKSMNISFCQVLRTFNFFFLSIQIKRLHFLFVLFRRDGSAVLLHFLFDDKLFFRIEFL